MKEVWSIILSIWRHPVWSKVIAGAIIGLILWVWKEPAWRIVMVIAITVFTIVWVCANYIKEQENNNKLLVYFTKDEIKLYTKNYIQPYFQEDFPYFQNSLSNNSIKLRKRIIPLFINTVFKRAEFKNRFFIVLADSGMGKTAFVINLFIKLNRKVSFKKRRIVFIPLWLQEAHCEIEKVCESCDENTVVLIDALDEDKEAIESYAKFEERLYDIYQKLAKCKTVIITSRVQFFPYDKIIGEIISSLRKHVGYEKIREIYLSPLSKKDINKYIWKKLSFWDWQKRKKAKEIVKRSPDLMTRPFLLSNIDYLLQENNNAHKYAYKIYEHLVNKWIEKDAINKNINPEQHEKELLEFSRKFAIRIYYEFKNNNISNFALPLNQAIELTEKEQIKLEKHDIIGRSLLNYDAKGNLKFSHRSILEYFLAKECFRNPEFYQNYNFSEIDTTQNFLSEMFVHNLMQCEGEFRLKNKKGTKALINLTLDKIPDIIYLKLQSYSGVQIQMLKFFKNLEELVLIDMDLLTEVYLLYFINFLERREMRELDLRELREWMERIEMFDRKALLDSQELRYLQNLYDFIDRLNLLDSQELLELQYLREFVELRDFRELKERIELLDTRNLLDLLKWLGLLESQDLFCKIKKQSSELLKRLFNADTVFKEIGILKGSMKNCKVYY